MKIPLSLLAQDGNAMTEVVLSMTRARCKKNMLWRATLRVIGESTRNFGTGNADPVKTALNLLEKVAYRISKDDKDRVVESVKDHCVRRALSRNSSSQRLVYSVSQPDTSLRRLIVSQHSSDHQDGAQPRSTVSLGHSAVGLDHQDGAQPRSTIRKRARVCPQSTDSSAIFAGVACSHTTPEQTQKTVWDPEAQTGSVDRDDTPPPTEKNAADQETQTDSVHRDDAQTQTEEDVYKTLEQLQAHTRKYEKCVATKVFLEDLPVNLRLLMLPG